DYALRLKKELGEDRTWVAGYANDVMAYIPSLRVLKEGGYEGGGAMVYYGLPTVWGPRIEELIVAAVHRQAKQARATLTPQTGRVPVGGSTPGQPPLANTQPKANILRGEYGRYRANSDLL